MTRIAALAAVVLLLVLETSGGAATEAAEVTCTGHTKQVGRVILGSAEDDIILCRGSAISLVIFGLEGADIIGAGDRNDWLIGGPGKDNMFGSFGDDSLLGEEGDDRLFGGDGDDIILGGVGDDWMWGQQGKDFCDGEGGTANWRSPSCLEDLMVRGLPMDIPPWIESLMKSYGSAR